MGRKDTTPRVARSRRPILEGLEARQLLASLLPDVTYVGKLALLADGPSGVSPYSVGTPIGSAPATDANADPHVEGITAGYTLVAGINQSLDVGNFADYGGATVTSASIDWGDGSAATSTGTITQSDMTHARDGTVSADHTYAQAGDYTATITLTDSGGASVIATTHIVVESSAISQVRGLTFMPATGISTEGFQVATFRADDFFVEGSDITATIDWGDGTTSAGTAGSGPFFGITGDHIYAHAGTYDTSITVTDPTGFTTTVAGQAVVSDEAITGHGLPIAALRGVGVGQPIPATVATFTDSPIGLPAEDYSATIDWGDGTTSAGTILAVGPIYVTGDHAYAADGTYTLSVTLTSIAGATASATSTATVADLLINPDRYGIDPPPGFASTIGVATFHTADPQARAGDFRATIDWGDGTAPTAGTVTPSSLADGTFGVSGQHSYPQVGDYTLTLTIADAAGHSTTVTEPAHVTEAVPGAGSFGSPTTPVGVVNRILVTMSGGGGPGHVTVPVAKPVAHTKGAGAHHPTPPKSPAHKPRPKVAPAATLHLPPGVKPLAFFKPFSLNFRYPAPTSWVIPTAIPARPAAARLRHR